MRVGIVAGELSGDTLGAGLITALRARVPEATFEGVGGPQMAAAGFSAWHDYETLAVMGLTEVLKHLPRLLSLRKALVQRWCDQPPDVFIGIDAPDFNLGLEQRLRQQGIRAVHYVSPSVWAWREKRVHKVAKACERVLCLLPFEPEFYARHGVCADFVGHPLAQRIRPVEDIAAARRELNIDPAAPTLALLPGSRAGEVAKLGQDFVETAAALQAKRPALQVLVPLANEARATQFRAMLAERPRLANLRISVGDAGACMAAADVLLCASGTVTLEGLLYGKPMVVAYRLAGSTYRIARMFNLVKLAHFSLPNLLTTEPLVPEFIQDEVTVDNLVPACERMFDDTQLHARIASEFAAVHRQLAVDADARAADAVLRTLAQTPSAPPS
ncbi:MAG: lipid-A-disaccharide synthase [Pseudomonadota bacterium]